MVTKYNQKIALFRASSLNRKIARDLIRFSDLTCSVVDQPREFTPMCGLRYFAISDNFVNDTWYDRTADSYNGVKIKRRSGYEFIVRTTLDKRHYIIGIARIYRNYRAIRVNSDDVRGDAITGREFQPLPRFILSLTRKCKVSIPIRSPLVDPRYNLVISQVLSQNDGQYKDSARHPAIPFEAGTRSPFFLARISRIFRAFAQTAIPPGSPR